MNTKIDIVYTWVNSSEKEFEEGLKNHAKSAKDLQKNRFRDIHDTLRYSIRSVEKYAPWVNKIHIVTQRPQKPQWLNDASDKIQLVHHDEFIPEEYLPTFNPRVIQSFFHLIPNSKDHLIYMNDDYLFANPIDRTDFLTYGTCKLKVYGSLLGIPLKFRVYAQKWQVKGLPRFEHTPFIIYKPFWIETLNIKPKSLKSTRLSKFRKSDNLRMDRLYRYFLLSRRRNDISVVFGWELLRVSLFFTITDDLDKLDFLRRKLSNGDYKFLCLNDNQRSEPSMEVVQAMFEILDSYLPDKSQFEIG